MVCRVYGGQAKIMAGFPTSGARLVEEAVAFARREENAHSLAWALGRSCAYFPRFTMKPRQQARFASEAIETAREHTCRNGSLSVSDAWAGRCIGSANFASGTEPPATGREAMDTTPEPCCTRRNARFILAEGFLREGRDGGARPPGRCAGALRELRRRLSRRRNRTIGGACCCNREQAPAEIVEECLVQIAEHSPSDKEPAYLNSVPPRRSRACWPRRASATGPCDLLAPVYELVHRRVRHGRSEGGERELLDQLR